MLSTKQEKYMKHIIQKVTNIYKNFLTLNSIKVQVEYEDGHVQTLDRLLVEGKSAASVFIFDKKNDLTLMVEQFRIGMVNEKSALSIECPAGLIDEGETALQAITREVKEETGQEVDKSKFKQISEQSYLSCGTMSQTLSIFTYECDLSNVKEGIFGTDSEEYIQTRLIPYTEMVRRLKDLEIKHVSQIAAIQSTLLD